MEQFTINKEEFVNKKFNAKECNTAAHHYIALQERPSIQMIIENAAKNGNFKTIIERMHNDNRVWLNNLGFRIDYNSSGYVIGWEDK